MPNYEYECRVCAHQFEAFHLVADRAKQKCKACGKPVMILILACSVRTEDNNPYKEWYPNMTRGEAKAHMDSENIGITSGRDRDHTKRQRNVKKTESKKAFRETTKEYAAISPEARALSAKIGDD